MKTLRAQLVSKLVKHHAVNEKVWEGRDDGFTSLELDRKEFAHFHNDNEIDVRLTKKLIKLNQLTHPSGSKNHPNRSKNSVWVELRFHDQSDVEVVYDLISQLIRSTAFIQHQE